MRTSQTLLCLCLISLSMIFIQPIPSFSTHDQNPLAQDLDESLQMTTAQEVGDNRSFWALNFDTSEHYIVDAHLLAIGNHCYIYFDDQVISIIGLEEANARAATYRDEFDNNIYERVTDLAGDPDGTLGDIDGDPRVYILIIEDYQSYYIQSNDVPGEYSNLCEIVYICYYATYPVNTIAHEFHHLVWFNNEFDEVHFLLEGAAEYATYYSGYIPASNRTTRAQYFLADIDDSLIYFEVEPQDYGACYLFAFYLAEQYGVQFLLDLVQHPDDGSLGLENALDEAGYNISFNELYLDWMTALTIDESGFADDRYYYKDMDPTIQDYTNIVTLPFQDNNLGLYCYGSKLYQLISPPDSFRLELSQPSDGVAGISVAYRDARGWHVQQRQEEGAAVLQVTGESIEEAHVIVSYLFSDTPAGGIDFGSGLRETVQISIEEWSGSTPPPTDVNNPLGLLLIAGALPLTAAMVIVVLHREKSKTTDL